MFLNVTLALTRFILLYEQFGLAVDICQDFYLRWDLTFLVVCSGFISDTVTQRIAMRLTCGGRFRVESLSVK